MALSTANERNNLKAVTRGKRSLRMPGAGNNLSIDFNRHATPRDFEFLKQIDQGHRRRDFPRLPVHDNFNPFIAWRRNHWPAILRTFHFPTTRISVA